MPCSLCPSCPDSSQRCVSHCCRATVGVTIDKSPFLGERCVVGLLDNCVLLGPGVSPLQWELRHPRSCCLCAASGSRLHTLALAQIDLEVSKLPLLKPCVGTASLHANLGTFFNFIFNKAK